jgi:catechol 2,3-dioxygenase-like lactoylglutathione lyase family enzyme
VCPLNRRRISGPNNRSMTTTLRTLSRMLGRTRKHWWGIVLEAPDPHLLAGFYSGLLGWEIVTSEPNYVVIAPLGEHAEYIGFQRSPSYVPPVWPAEDGKQQMMLHIDIEVPDLERAMAEAVAAGARLAAFQPQEAVRVLLDPAGHPFCLYVG